MNKNSNTSKYHFKNLVFEGGGVKGIAYVGALEVLDQEGILKDIKRVAGTSAGAMVAVLIGLGYSAAELRDILWNLNFQNFLDDSWGYIRDAKRFITDYGWYKGDFFRNLMADFIKQKTGNGEATFKDLQDETKYKDINLIGADLSTGCTKVFNARNTPDVKVADAARISMSIPLFFAAVKGVNKDTIFMSTVAFSTTTPSKSSTARILFMTSKTTRNEPTITKFSMKSCRHFRPELPDLVNPKTSMYTTKRP